MFINAHSYVSAYALRDPTTAEALLTVSVTGFGTPKLSVDWEVKAEVFGQSGTGYTERKTNRECGGSPQCDPRPFARHRYRYYTTRVGSTQPAFVTRESPG
ncbi:MAG: hypothetical protein J4G05_09145 [Chlorobi bacterium]|nr:hypothetical protein [Chlorobiota bacterium]